MLTEQEIENRVSLETLGHYFKGTHKTVLVSLIVPVIVIAVMWSEINHLLLLGWALLMFAGIVAKHFIAAAFIKQEIPSSEVARWGARASWPTFFLGMLWVVAMFAFFVDGSVAHKIFLITIIISLGVYSIIGGIYWFSLHYLYGVPITCALVIRLAMEGEFAYWAVALMIFLSMLMITSVARRLNLTVRSEMRLRHQSFDLSRALQVKTDEAEQAVLAKSRVLAAASHDLRQPLHALSLFLDVLKYTDSDVERRNIFPRIDQSLDALRKLFDALLDVSRLDAKVVKPEYTHFDIADLLNDLVEEFGPLANARGLRLELHAGSVVVVTDRMLLERILRNLIGNAIRYTDKGRVLVAARKRKEEVLLQVWDTGIGIPRENQDVIFNEFQQLHNQHRDRAEGLGLGLAIVQRLCQLLSYPLELRSEFGRGSVFGIRVPRGSGSMTVKNDRVAPELSWELRGRRVLVIDDEVNILSAMDALLTKWGSEVLTAETPEEAIAKLKKLNLAPDVVLSDLRLRDNQNGIDAIDAVKAIFGQDIPGVLITGDSSPEQIRQAEESGYRVLQKPVRPIQLRSIIQHHLSATAK